MILQFSCAAAALLPLVLTVGGYGSLSRTELKLIVITIKSEECTVKTSIYSSCDNYQHSGVSSYCWTPVNTVATLSTSRPGYSARCRWSRFTMAIVVRNLDGIGPHMHSGAGCFQFTEIAQAVSLFAVASSC